VVNVLCDINIPLDEQSLHDIFYATSHPEINSKFSGKTSKLSVDYSI